MTMSGKNDVAGGIPPKEPAEVTADVLARQRELDQKAIELAEKEKALQKQAEEIEESKKKLAEQKNLDRMAQEKNRTNLWKVVSDCFAGNVLYHEGDTVQGGDFSGNPNFKKLN